MPINFNEPFANLLPSFDHSLYLENVDSKEEVIQDGNVSNKNLAFVGFPKMRKLDRRGYGTYEEARKQASRESSKKYYNKIKREFGEIVIEILKYEREHLIQQLLQNFGNQKNYIEVSYNFLKSVKYLLRLFFPKKSKSIYSQHLFIFHFCKNLQMNPEMAIFLDAIKIKRLNLKLEKKFLFHQHLREFRNTSNFLV